MKIDRIILTVTLIGLAIVCAFSFTMYINFSRLLDIPRETLKSGAFDLSHKTYQFTFTTPKEARYNVIIRFVLENEGDPIGKYKVPHTIIAELRDNDYNLLRTTFVDQNSRIPQSWSNKEFERYFLSFNAKKKQTFKLKMTFHSNNELLNKIRKEIYIEKDYDYAAKPWWKVFQIVFLIVFATTLLAILIIGLILRQSWKRDKGKEKGDRIVFEHIRWGQTFNVHLRNIGIKDKSGNNQGQTFIVHFGDIGWR